MTRLFWWARWRVQARLFKRDVRRMRRALQRERDDRRGLGVSE